MYNNSLLSRIANIVQLASSEKDVHKIQLIWHWQKGCVLHIASLLWHRLTRSHDTGLIQIILQSVLVTSLFIQHTPSRGCKVVQTMTVLAWSTVAASNSLLDWLAAGCVCFIVWVDPSSFSAFLWAQTQGIKMNGPLYFNNFWHIAWLNAKVQRSIAIVGDESLVCKRPSSRTTHNTSGVMLLWRFRTSQDSGTLWRKPQ